MWSKVKSRVTDEHIDTLLGRAESVVMSANSKEAVQWGKDFFSGESSEENNLDLLRQIHLDIWPEISDTVGFSDAVIDHAALLIKGSGGAATRLHQDSAYWVGRETSPTIFSVWIALEDMSKEKGGLMLSAPNEVGVSDMSSFSTGSTLDHEMVADVSASGGFPLLIKSAIASQMEESMKVIDLV